MISALNDHTDQSPIRKCDAFEEDIERAEIDALKAKYPEFNLPYPTDAEGWHQHENYVACRERRVENSKRRLLRRCVGEDLKFPFGRVKISNQMRRGTKEGG